MGFFAPQGRHVAPINVKFGTGERTVCPLRRLSGQKCGNTAPKTVKKIELWPVICTSGVTRLQNSDPPHFLASGGGTKYCLDS